MRPLCREGDRACPPGGSGVILLGLFLGILSCAPIAPQTTNYPDSGLTKSWDMGELAKNLAQRNHQLRSLRTLATISYWGEDGRAGFQEAILVHRPDRLRLETLSPLGAILIVTADGDEIMGFHPREGLFYRGRSSKENLFRYTQIPLELGELTSLLMGLPPLGAQGRWEEGGNSFYRELVGGERERIVFHPTLGVPVRWERLSVAGEIELSALFSDFFPTPDGPFPLKISLEAHTRQKRLEIHYQEPELNVTIPLPFFVQQKPANAREIPLESLGG